MISTVQLCLLMRKYGKVQELLEGVREEERGRSDSHIAKGKERRCSYTPWESSRWGGGGGHSHDATCEMALKCPIAQLRSDGYAVWKLGFQQLSRLVGSDEFESGDFVVTAKQRAYTREHVEATQSILDQQNRKQKNHQQGVERHS